MRGGGVVFESKGRKQEWSEGWGRPLLFTRLFAAAVLLSPMPPPPLSMRRHTARTPPGPAGGYPAPAHTRPSCPGTLSRRTRAPNHAAPAAFFSFPLSEPAITAAAASLFSAATVYSVCLYGVTLTSTRKAMVRQRERKRTRSSYSSLHFLLNLPALIFISFSETPRHPLPIAPLVALWAAAIGLVLASPPARALVAGAVAAGWAAATAPRGAPTPGWLPAFAAAFAHPAVSAAAWVHLLAIDMVQARWILSDGVRSRTPTRHSLVLTLMAGPLGLVSHALTRAAVRRQVGADDGTVTYRF